MSRTTTTPLAVAADYADALMTARRAKNWLFLLVALMILAQLAIFLLARFDVLKLSDTVTLTAATTQPTDKPVATSATTNLDQIFSYVTPLIEFVALAFSIVLAVVLLLLVTIMLVGRLIGVSHVTSAFCWAILLIAILIPWQTLFISQDLYPVTGASASVVEQPSFKFPGALYTWAELKHDYKFSNDPIWPTAVWGWLRFAFYPFVALLLLLLVQIKSGRGLKFALGETEMHVEVTQRTDTGTMIQ